MLPAPNARFLPPSGQTDCLAVTQLSEQNHIRIFRNAARNPDANVIQCKPISRCGSNIAGWHRDIQQDLPASELRIGMLIEIANHRRQRGRFALPVAPVTRIRPFSLLSNSGKPLVRQAVRAAGSAKVTAVTQRNAMPLRECAATQSLVFRQDTAKSS